MLYSLAGRVQHAHVVEARIRGDARGVRRLVRASAGGDRRHDGAVTVGVGKRVAVVGDLAVVLSQADGAGRIRNRAVVEAAVPHGAARPEHVDAAPHPRLAPRVGEVAVRRHDAGIEHRDADAAAVEPAVAGAAHRRVPRARDRLDRALAANHRPVGRHAHHVLALGERMQLIDRHLDRDGMYAAMEGHHGAADTGDVRAQIAELGIAAVRHDDGLDLAHAVHLARPALRLALVRRDVLAQVARDLRLGRDGLCAGHARQAAQCDEQQAHPPRDVQRRKAAAFDQDGEAGARHAEAYGAE